MFKPHSSATSGTLNIGTNGTITVSGSNYGTLSCSSSNTNIATCSVSGTTVTIVPKAVGSATITVTGAGGTNYNSISKTYTATVQTGTTYVYWIQKSGAYDGVKVNHSTAINTSNTSIVYGSTPSISLCKCNYTGYGCSNCNYCAMMRDVYISSRYDHREVCLYDRINNKVFCIPHGYYTGDMTTTNTKLKSDMKTAFGTEPNNCYTTNKFLYCSYPHGDSQGGTGAIYIYSDGSISSRVNHSSNPQACAIGPLSTSDDDSYCKS